MKKAMTIEWHKARLTRMLDQLGKECRELYELSDKVERLKGNIAWYQCQIEDAIRQKKDKLTKVD